MELPVITEGVGGFECGYGKCRDAESFAKCLDCCGVKCVDTEGCAEFCLFWWGAKNAIEAMGKAAVALQDHAVSMDPQERALAIGMLEKMQGSKSELVRRCAVKLATDGVPGVRVIGT